MCGIVGVIEPFAAMSTDELHALVVRMRDNLVHRGPDACGAWADPGAGIAIAHRRLSILDLSPNGHQPMHSLCGRYVVVFNGEIYNFAELRDELDRAGNSIRWRGHSDTEVLLAAVTRWGLAKALKRFIGMFALALWDRGDRLLYLARDRLGEKPLYYGWANGALLFASELKALRAHPAFRAEVNRNALALLMRHNYVPGPYSIYESVYKLPPGTYLSIPFTKLQAGRRDFEPMRYWSMRRAAETGIANQIEGSEAEITQQLEELLQASIKRQMVADVPLGAFLSGGIDSSTVVALMQAQSERKVKTFSIGFREDGYNEAHHAKAVALQLETDHTELYVTPNQAMEVIPKLPTLYDEPFADSSQIPTYLVSALARRHVTVSLSGDGGDELFGGYNRYFWGRDIWRKVGAIPIRLRGGLASALMSVSPERWESIFKTFGSALPAKLKQRNPGDKLHKLAEILVVDSPESLYLGLVSHWKQPASLVLGAIEPTTPLNDRTQRADLSDFTQRMMYLDLITYLPDDILVKVDRAAMGVSLESRVPFLDHRVVEFAWRVPLSMKVRNGEGKWLLRQVLYKYVPQKLIERPKMGFGVPIDSWLRGPLREWVEELISEPRLRSEGFFRPEPIRKKWQEHLSGRRNWQYHLWDVLMFQAWLEETQARAVNGRVYGTSPT